ncbi:hypothetical protein [Pimelobacter simplex]|uniref:hypothetical protein n=1 Tax=Nocardioides simplex TaxID=2045 RepID=UPI0021505D56|nr:hypothetical protein [Pimelobacter simplex]UUW91758.1 hypothetical protein M0M43_09805 [Pimelobacter simplex]UUW95586.1 hypothetical protein M0M48_28305 [Pimelobacter simplex]
MLARKGSLTRRELREELTLTLVGQDTTPTLLTEALERAQSQDLLLRYEGRKGKLRWGLPEGVKAEAAADRDWAELILSEAEAEVRSRLVATFPHDAEIAGRAPKLTKEVVGAMVRSSRGVFDAVQRSASPNDLREVRLNLRAAVPEIRSRVHPAALADFVAELLLSAASPDEAFGNELLSTIVAGQILHGMVCREDVEGPMPTASLVLDTSELLSLASHDDRVVELFTTFLETASSHGSELILTSRVQKEWEAHWEQADVFIEQLVTRYADDLGEALKLHQHHVIREYGYARDRDARSFETWAKGRRDLEPLVRRYSVRIVDTDDFDFDVDFVEMFTEEIKRLQLELGRIRVRGAELRTTDGISAAVVRDKRLRAAESLVPSAWFVASDRSSEEAYRNIVDDPFPLGIRASTWLLHYAAFDGRASLEGRATFADRLSEDLILGAFLSVAATYTNDEMLELGDLLSEGDQLDRADVQQFLADGFLDPEGVHKNGVRDFARARLLRQGDRVVRTKRVDGERARAAEARLDEANAEISNLKRRVSSRTGESMTLRRALEAVVVIGVLVLGWLTATTLQLLPGKVLVLGWLALAYLGFEAFHYVTDHDSSRKRRVVAVGITAVLAITSFYVDQRFEL